MIKIKIREYQSTDRQQLVELWKLTFPNDPPWNEPNSMLDRKLKMKDNLIFLAVSDENIVGSVMAGWDGVRGWIYHLAVATASRRSGVGTLLMKSCEAALKTLGCVKINLQVRTSNLEVIAFYESIGFKQDEVVSLGKHLI